MMRRMNWHTIVALLVIAAAVIAAGVLAWTWLR